MQLQWLRCPMTRSAGWRPLNASSIAQSMSKGLRTSESIGLRVWEPGKGVSPGVHQLVHQSSIWRVDVHFCSQGQILSHLLYLLSLGLWRVEWGTLHQEGIFPMYQTHMMTSFGSTLTYILKIILYLVSRLFLHPVMLIHNNNHYKLHFMDSPI
jgi:hypothetical protein